MIRRYQFKLYPSADQAKRLREQAHMCADLWNAFLQRREEIYRRTVGQKGVVHATTWTSVRKRSGEVVTIGPGPNGRPRGYSFEDATNEFTWLRQPQNCPEWGELSVWVGHRVARALDEAFQHFFRRVKAGRGAQAGYPRYKRRKDAVWVPMRFASGCRLTHLAGQTWRLAMQGLDVPIHARGTLPCEPEEWTDADVLYRDGRWWLSVCVDVDRPRVAGRRPVVVRLDLLDGFAMVDNVPETPPMLWRAFDLSRRADELQSAFDLRWPRGKLRGLSHEQWRTRADEQAALSRCKAKAARVRRDALHVWTARLVARASGITVIMPRMSEAVRSPRGGEREWGAEVETASESNRTAREYAPAMAAAMLKYKAEEAGIRCEIVEDLAPKIAVATRLVAAGKQQRRIARQIRRAENGEGVDGPPGDRP